MRNLLLTGATLLISALANPATAQQIVELRYGHVTQTDNSFHAAATMFRDAVAKATNGTLKITIYPARQLGDDRQLLEGVRQGTIDAALVSSPTFGLFTPVIDAVQLPFLIPNYEALADVMTSPAAQKLLDNLDNLGIKGLGIYEGGNRNLVTRTKPVRSTADLAGLKIRVVPSPLHVAIFKALGATPTAVSFAELFTALQTGTVEGMEMNANTVLSEKYYEQTRSFTATGHFFFPAVSIINGARFKQLSPEHQRAIVQATRDTIRQQIEWVAKKEADAGNELKRRGMTMLTLEDIPVAKKMVAPVIRQWEEKSPAIAEFSAYLQQRYK